jgi:HSP20 family protein
MALLKWDPFRELNVARERMTDLFGNGPWGSEEPMSTTTWSPSVDIFETERELTIKAELPGMEEKDIEVRLENNVLMIKGERRFEKEAKKENYHRVEWSYGTFNRSFSLPAFVDETKVKAEYKNGVLKVVLPKKEELKPKEIKISVA